MNQPKQPISKMETISDTEERRIKLSNGNGLLAHIDIADEVVSFSNYHVKFKVDELSFDDIAYLATVINNLPSRAQHSYSKQEVRNMLEALRQRCAKASDNWYHSSFPSAEQSILSINFDDLLIKK